MNRSLLVFVSVVFFTLRLDAQTCQTNATTTNFFTTCDGGPSYNDPDDYTIRIRNGETMIINGDVTITGTLTINMLGASALVIVQSPHTLEAGNIIFTGSATTGKVLEVDGAITVDQTLDFGDFNVDVDGSGSIDAMTIDNADNVDCSGDGDCPMITSTSCDDGASGTFCNDVLPIELTFFRVEPTGSNVVLKWQTASEENNDFFTIERSVDARQYEVVAIMKGAGTSFSSTDYAFPDTNPVFGTSYYRLKQTDFDGRYEYFGPIPVFFTQVDASLIKVFPNPVKPGQSVEVITGADNNEPVGVRVLDLQGKMLYRSRASGSVSSVLLPNFSPGIYLVEVTAGGLKKMERLSIQ